MPVGYKLVIRQFLPFAVLYSGAVDFPPKTASKSTLIVEEVVLGGAEWRGKPEKKSWVMKHTHEVISLIPVKPESLKKPKKKSNYHQQSQDDTQKHMLVYDH